MRERCEWCDKTSAQIDSLEFEVEEKDKKIKELRNALVKHLHEEDKYIVELEAKDKTIAELRKLLIDANSLPVITCGMFDDFIGTCLMEWDKKISHPSWTQTAVDFACILTTKGSDK